MLLGKIVGTVVATRKDPRLVSSKLLVVRPMDPRGNAEGGYLVAIDTVDAGIDDEVVVCLGAPARWRLGSVNLPIDAAVMAIVDRCDLDRAGSLFGSQAAVVWVPRLTAAHPVYPSPRAAAVSPPHPLTPSPRRAEAAGCSGWARESGVAEPGRGRLSSAE